MYANFLHVPRYLGWALLGAGLYVESLLLMFDVSLFHMGVTGLTIVGAIGAIPLLLLRVGVGLTIRDPLDADRMTGILVARLVIGGVLGWVAADQYQKFAPLDRFHHRMFFYGWWKLAFVLAGASALVSTAWLYWRRYWRVFLPLSWAAVFALGVSAWFVLYKEAPFKWAPLPPARHSVFTPVVFQ